MNNHIFISYSSKDKKIAFQLVEYLESNGINCWIAPRNIVSGHDYTDTIDDAIKHCDGIVLIFSDCSAKSIWVKKEITLGVSHQKNVIPFKITHTETDGGFNFMLNNLQWIDGTGHPTDKFPEIVEGLKRYDASLSNVTPTAVKRTIKKQPIIIAAVSAVAICVAVPLAINNKRTSTSDTPVVDTVYQVNVDQSNQNAAQVEAPVQVENAVEKQKVTKSSSDDKAKKTVKDETKGKNSSTQESKEAVTVEAPPEKVEVKQEVSTPQPPKETTPTKPQNTTNPLYSKAVKLYNAKHYSDALRLFEELKNSGCKEPYIDSYISKCRANIN